MDIVEKKKILQNENIYSVYVAKFICNKVYL